MGGKHKANRHVLNLPPTSWKKFEDVVKLYKKETGLTTMQFVQAFERACDDAKQIAMQRLRVQEMVEKSLNTSASKPVEVLPPSVRLPESLSVFGSLVHHEKSAFAQVD